MRNRLIPKIMYHLYDLLNGGRLSSYHQQVKRNNDLMLLHSREDIGDYLQRWGFNPVLEKNPLMNKEDVKKWLAKTDLGKVKSWAYTGGSYGEPLRVPYSKKRSLIRTATFKYYNELAGYRLGDPYVLIRAKSKSEFTKMLRNETIFIPKDLAESRIREFVSLLKNRKIKVLMGYPTVMYELALFFEKYPEEKNGLFLESLISVSEPLPDYLREVIYSQFNCRFVDRYSNEEVGLIAQQREFRGEHFVNRFGVVVEVVDPESLQPVDEGRQGKVLVTDINNDLIPVVRYDTGDLAVAHSYRDEQLVSITKITGRVTEKIYSVAGSPVSPLILGPYIYVPLSKQGPVYQYQFAQTGKKTYELRIKAPENELPDEVLEIMKEGLISVLGETSEVGFIFLDDIKSQPSGKRPIFKNEMTN